MGQTITELQPNGQREMVLRGNSIRDRAGIGHSLSLLKEDGSVIKCILTDAKCKDAIARALGDPEAALTTREPLGRAVLGAAVGERRHFLSSHGEGWVWVIAIEPGPDFRRWSTR
jgi:transcription elongation GreA/GreB family factor